MCPPFSGACECVSACTHMWESVYVHMCVSVCWLCFIFVFQCDSMYSDGPQ